MPESACCKSTEACEADALRHMGCTYTSDNARKPSLLFVRTKHKQCQKTKKGFDEVRSNLVNQNEQHGMSNPHIVLDLSVLEAHPDEQPKSKRFCKSLHCQRFEKNNCREALSMMTSAQGTRLEKQRKWRRDEKK
jgi:hypothetical protein